MRERITVSFVLLALVVLLAAGSVRAFSHRDLVREQESEHLHHDAELISQIVARQRETGVSVDRRLLAMLVAPHARVEYEPPSGQSVVVRGEEYAGTEEGDDLSATETSEAGTVTVSRAAVPVTEIVGQDKAALATLLLLLAVFAGLAGYAAARTLSAPFQRLAVAAGALGRGRFDLDLPRTRIPEARAIGAALRTSAEQLRARMSRERDFAEHTSHVLRTPLTSLRLELDDLTLRDDVPDDAKAAAARCIRSVDRVHAAADELVSMSRGSLVEGAEVPLHAMATQLAQRWADRLADRHRTLSARVEGDLDLRFTPGPVEQVLDLVLADVVAAPGPGPVQITFVGDDGYLRVRLLAGVLEDGVRRRRPRSPRGHQAGSGVAEARSVAEAQGGRVTGDGVSKDLELLLPRR